MGKIKPMRNKMKQYQNSTKHIKTKHNKTNTKSRHQHKKNNACSHEGDTKTKQASNQTNKQTNKQTTNNQAN